MFQSWFCSVGGSGAGQTGEVDIFSRQLDTFLVDSISGAC